MIRPMQALERLWDRPAVRWPFALLAAFVLFAGLRSWYVHTQSHTPSGPVVAGGQPLGIAAYGQRIKLPQKAVAAARTFIHTAVLRKNLDLAWRDSTAKVHAGLTHAQWMSGAIPVFPFQRDAYGGTRYKVEWSRSKNVMLLVLISPDKPGVKSGEFFIQMVPRGSRWLVDYFGPRGTNPPLPAAEVH
jgi:hypothetical protein